MYITPKNFQPTKAVEIKHHFRHQKKGREKKSVLKEEHVILSDNEPLSKKKKESLLTSQLGEVK